MSVPMYDPKAKRKRRIKLTFTYAVMILATLGLLIVAVFLAQGYLYNQYDGKIEQGGMIQFDSSPSGATIQLDAAQLSGRTASRITATAGEHTVTISRDGYAPWQKQVVVKAGSVLWLNYIRLLPSEPTTATAATFTDVSSALASPSHERLALITDAAEPTITFARVGDSAISQSEVTLDADKFTAPNEGEAQSFELKKWSNNNQRVLVEHKYGENLEYILVSTDGAAQNITTQFGVAISSFEFDPTDSQVAYVLTTNHEIRRLSLSSATLSGPLVTNASSMTVAYNGWVGYATLPDLNGARTVGYVSKGQTTPRTVETFAGMTDRSLNFSIGRYYNETYQLVTAGNTTTIYKGSLSASDATDELQKTKIAQLPLSDDVAYAGFSPNQQRFVYAQNGQNIVTYDLELGAISTVTPSVALAGEVQWLDDYHLLSAANGVEYADYDGTNTNVVVRETALSTAFLSSSEDYFYYFVKDDSGATLLVRLSMVQQ